MEFCFYCSRFPTPGQAWGCTPGNSRLGAAAYAALAGGVGARPRRGISGLCWKRQVLLVPGGCTPGNSRLGAAAYAALAGEASARPRRGISGLCWKRQVLLVPGGYTPGNSRLWSWSPVGTVQDRPRRQPRRRLNAALVGEASARPRHGFLGTPAAWNFAFPSLKLHKTGVNCRKSMVPGWKTLAKQAILRYYGKVNGAGGLPRRPPG